MQDKRSEKGIEEVVDAAGMDSFPASDPPPWAATHAGTPAILRGPELFHHVVQGLHDDVLLLSEKIGERNDRSPFAQQNLEVAALAIEERFRQTGLPVKRRPGGNIEAVVQGDHLASESIVVGAHYDTLRGSPGADDNASGVAALVAIARTLSQNTWGRTVRLVAFAREEPPHTGSSTMGSALYLDDLERQGTTVKAMISLESLGRGPLAIVGKPGRMIRRAKEVIDESATGVVATLPLFSFVFHAARVASHLSFSARGIPAFLITNRVPFWSGRDGAEYLDYEELGHATTAISDVVRDLALVSA